jgi:hypothetical protein
VADDGRGLWEKGVVMDYGAVLPWWQVLGVGVVIGAVLWETITDLVAQWCRSRGAVEGKASAVKPIR